MGLQAFIGIIYIFFEGGIFSLFVHPLDSDSDFDNDNDDDEVTEGEYYHDKNNQKVNQKA